MECFVSFIAVHHIMPVRSSRANSRSTASPGRQGKTIASIPSAGGRHPNTGAIDRNITAAGTSRVAISRAATAGGRDRREIAASRAARRTTARAIGPAREGDGGWAVQCVVVVVVRSARPAPRVRPTC
ncbi:hypothetical protein Misp02_31300 [Microtetraspora sp. NBRC 16547]|nr:hypothetical protein Misp02_31300 [Microtetraspora sp. NBRC 16547]